MSANMCSNIIDMFREFFYLKVNLIDPMIINTNFLMNCYYQTDSYLFNFEYNTRLEDINNCATSGGTSPECIQVCSEFKIGESSDMFMGNLTEYQTFMTNLENLVKDFDSSISTSEYFLTIDNETFEGEFFKTDNSNLSKNK